MKKPASRRARLAAVARESERALRELIIRWQARPPAQRTHFLRKRVGLAARRSRSPLLPDAVCGMSSGSTATLHAVVTAPARACCHQQ